MAMAGGRDMHQDQRLAGLSLRRRRRAPASRLKPTSSAVPTASAKEENNNNNEEERLDIHDVPILSVRWLQLWLVHNICVGPDDIIWDVLTDKKEVGEFRDNDMSVDS